MTEATEGTPPPLRDPGGRFVPSRDALERQSTGELVETLRRFGVEVDVERLLREATVRIERIAVADRPDRATLIDSAGRVEAFMQRELAREAKDYVRRLEMVAHGLRGPGSREKVAVWQAVGDDRTCESCDDRHGEEATMDEWNGRGVPGSPNLVCDGNCRCELIPKEWLSGPEDTEERETMTEVV